MCADMLTVNYNSTTRNHYNKSLSTTVVQTITISAI